MRSPSRLKAAIRARISGALRGASAMLSDFSGKRHAVDRLRQIAQRARLPPQHEHDDHGDDEAQHAGPEARREAEHAEGEDAAGGDDQRLARS